MANIKGFAIRGLLKFVKERKPGALPAILESTSPQSLAVFDQQIIASKWYPYSVFAELLRAIDREIGRGDLSLCPEIGEFAAGKDLSGMFKMLVSVLSPGMLLGRASIFWSKYCDTGRFTSVPPPGENQFIERLEDFPMIDEAQCLVLIGFIRRWGLMAKAREIEVIHETCVHHGGKWCEWRGTWKD